MFQTSDFANFPKGTPMGSVNKVDSGRQPRARRRAALHARRRRRRDAQHGDHRSLERQGRPEAGKNRMAPRRPLGQARRNRSPSTSPRASRFTSRAGCRRGSGTTRTATSATPPRSRGDRVVLLSGGGGGRGGGMSRGSGATRAWAATRAGDLRHDGVGSEPLTDDDIPVLTRTIHDGRRTQSAQRSAKRGMF